ncbi:hypothetical protein [Zhengella mangrovi]|uniref:hypothetical protein n=1 Tax=Zhengella mangrovi TaxID=1982044 RepID=UPI0013FDA2F7|nr:hypothetical protein [Zhengella mangrovi]
MTVSLPGGIKTLLSAAVTAFSKLLIELTFFGMAQGAAALFPPKCVCRLTHPSETRNMAAVMLLDQVDAPGQPSRAKNIRVSL